MYSPGGHGERPGQEAGDPGQQDEPALADRRARAGHAHHEREIGDQTVRDTEDDCP